MSEQQLTEEQIEKDLKTLERLAKLGQDTSEVDIGTRIKVLADPEKPETMSRLSPDQIDVVVICSDIEETFPVFKCLTRSNREMLLANISLDGLGRTEVVQLEQVENLIKDIGNLITPINRQDEKGKLKEDKKK